MKLGIAEIILILIIMSVVIIGIRFMGAGAAPRRRDESPERFKFEMEQQRRYDEQVKAARRSKIQILGIVVIIAGIAVFIWWLEPFKWVFSGLVGALLLVVIGIFAIFAARRR